MTPTYRIDVKSDGTWLIIETPVASALIHLENAVARNPSALKAVQALGDYLLTQPALPPPQKDI